MKDIKFFAEIKHSEESINCFAKAQFNIYRSKQRNTMLIISVLLLALGALVPVGDIISALLFFVACLVLVDIGHIPKRTASSMLKMMPEFDSFEYQFGEKSVKIVSLKSGASGILAYSKIEKLAEDTYNFYIFANSSTGYMIDKKSLSPLNKDAFKNYLSSASGCKWTSAKGIMGFTLQNLISNLKKR